LNLAGVSHFFLVPHIRTSFYTKLLSDKFPALRNSTPGAIQEPALPELRNLIVFDSTGEFPREAVELDFKCWTDWKEILVWDETLHERQLQAEISISLEKDEVINLQFTRFWMNLPRFIANKSLPVELPVPQKPSRYVLSHPMANALTNLSSPTSTF
jgi:hypothetical protein